MADLFASIVEGASVEIETALSPPVSIAVKNALTDKGGPGLLVQLLRPSVTVRKDGAVLFRVEPAGPPDPALRSVLIIVVAMLLALFVVRVTSR